MHVAGLIQFLNFKKEETWTTSSVAHHIPFQHGKIFLTQDQGPKEWKGILCKAELCMNVYVFFSTNIWNSPFLQNSVNVRRVIRLKAEVPISNWKHLSNSTCHFQMIQNLALNSQIWWLKTRTCTQFTKMYHKHSNTSYILRQVRYKE